jgi:hypothetical protein
MFLSPEVLPAIAINITAYWDMTQCSVEGFSSVSEEFVASFFSAAEAYIFVIRSTSYTLIV